MADAPRPGSDRPPRRARSYARSLRFTREGKYFVALALGIGFAAINTGNNLLFLVLGLMLSLIVGSGVLSEVSLRALSVSRQIPDRVFAGSPFLMGIGLANGKRRLPSFSIEVEDLLAGQALEKKCYFLKVPAGRTQHTSYRHAFPRRGVQRFDGYRVSTKFPFALFRKSRPLDGPAELVVFPALHPVTLPAGQPAEHGDAAAGRLDRRGDFHALREYQIGDDPRSIHWRKSARLQRLMVRLSEDESTRRVALFLDNQRRATPLTAAEDERQEQAVSHAASLAAEYIKRGYTVRLVTRTVSVGPGAGPAHLTRLLRALALLEFALEPLPYAAPPRWPGECIFVSPATALGPPPTGAAATAAGGPSGFTPLGGTALKDVPNSPRSS